MNIFKIIQDSIDIETVAERYGIHINHKKAFCPFHNDGKTPNLSFKNNHYKCFSCGAGGDVIDFVARLFNIKPLESAKKLNEDFALGIDTGKPVSKSHLLQVKRNNRILENFHQWEYSKFIEIMQRLEWCRIVTAYATPFSELWSQAINEQSILEYKADILILGDTQDKIEFYKNDKAGDSRIYGHTRRIGNVG